ncbi:MAG TPA: hypothetical protein VFO10_10325 [Oligoflexus sp.]|uniref:hypothetical protein n=1 Tax=Oligoflexus sp. TaxID=1971216 RepID=UPI002D803221|nr:hypothetical protein [Oligoflexus sp.]HET9237638.1 hypothetical protein [Oligoflexus sp.]
MSMRTLSTLFAALFSAVFASCGVEVGNPTEPTPAQPKESDGRPMVPGMPNVPIESIEPAEPVESLRINARYLVENQYDEALTAALEFAFDNSSASLIASNESLVCGVQPDGSLVLNHQETSSATRTSGQASSATQVTESLSRVFASRMQSPGVTLACNSELTRPKIDWNATQDVLIDGTLERTNSRLIVMDPSQAFVRESSVKSSGLHQSTIKNMKMDPAAGLRLQRSLTFGTDMEITNRTAQAAATQMRTRIETQADAPLIMEESYNAESKLKSLKITSGVVSSRKEDDGLMVVMRYSNVVMNADGGCRPTAGTITGEIFAPNDPTNARESFSIAFTEKQNLIVYADGTGSKLEFEPCRIETERKGNGSGRSGGRT